MRSSAHQRLAALEAAADRIIEQGRDDLYHRQEAVIGPEVARQVNQLVDEANRGEIDEAEYQKRYAALLRPYTAQIEADPEIIARWPALGRAVHYQEMVERMQLRKKTT